MSARRARRSWRSREEEREWRREEGEWAREAARRWSSERRRG